MVNLGPGPFSTHDYPMVVLLHARTSTTVATACLPGCLFLACGPSFFVEHALPHGEHVCRNASSTPAVTCYLRLTKSPVCSSPACLVVRFSAPVFCATAAELLVVGGCDAESQEIEGDCQSLSSSTRTYDPVSVRQKFSTKNVDRISTWAVEPGF